MRVSVGATCWLLACFLLSSSDAAAWNLSSPEDLPTTVSGPQAVELGDLDGDGRLDAVVVGKTSALYACYRGNGDGTFGEEIAVGSLYLQPTDLVLADFDGDGLLDIAAINNACSS
jgi:hypothetical protein